jgi:hypothetical protein
VVKVCASDPDLGVTCGEVIRGLSDGLHELRSSKDFDALPKSRKREVTEAYALNRSDPKSPLSRQIGDGLRRLDFLGRETAFAGIVADSKLVKKVVGEALAATFVVKCRQHVDDVQSKGPKHVTFA